MIVFGYRLVVTSFCCIVSLRTSYQVQELKEGEGIVLLFPHPLPPKIPKPQELALRLKIRITDDHKQTWTTTVRQYHDIFFNGSLSV